MKVYEVMNELAKMPAGAKVRINMVKSLNELPAFDGSKDRVIEFEVKEISADGGYVNIDGWTE